MGRLKIIGVTGPSGSGKGALCALLSDYGIPSVDADHVYHQLLVPPSSCLDSLCERFGSKILKGDGTLDRTVLANIVFAPEAQSELADLNRITHKFVVEKINDMISDFDKNGFAAAVIDAPALIEAEIDKKCDLVVCVVADKDTRIKRIVERDGIAENAALARVNAQKPDAFYEAHSDIIIRNNGDLSELKKDAEKIVEYAKGENN